MLHQLLGALLSQNQGQEIIKSQVFPMHQIQSLHSSLKVSKNKKNKNLKGKMKQAK
jgi:hypothetical protein